MMKRTAPHIRKLLDSSRPDSPYAPEPSRVDMLGLLESIGEGLAGAAEAKRLLVRAVAYTEWKKRREAVYVALVHHYGTDAHNNAILCPCDQCNILRAELKRLDHSKLTYSTKG